MTSGPVIIRIPVQKQTMRFDGVDVDGFQFRDFWRAEYADGESHSISNPIREWLWMNNNGVVPEILFVLEAGQQPDELAPKVDAKATTHGDIYNRMA